jgi:hypothetical protein
MRRSVAEAQVHGNRLLQAIFVGYELTVELLPLFVAVLHHFC